MILILTPAEFDALNAQLNIALGYPDAQGTLRYADPIPNPDDPTQVAMTIQDRVLPFLSDQQIESLVDDTAIAGWFKGPR